MRLAPRSALIGLLLCACSSKPATPPPAAPAGLTATGGAGQIALAWTAVSGADSYEVLRGDAAGAETSLAGSTAPAYTDTGLAAGQKYFYLVKAVGKGGKSGSSNEVSAVTAPPAPVNLTVVTTDTSAVVSWSAAAGAVSYDVLRAPGGTTSFAPVGTTTATTAADSGLTPNTMYLYVVRAKNDAGTSAEVTANATTAPVAPTGLMASSSNHHVALGWTAAPGAGAGGYRVLRATSAGGPFASAGTTAGTSFTDTLLANGTQYFYVVHTIGGSGESGDSNQANATPFIEICTVDAASYAVSVFDGMASGNVAPKRSFGWSTGIAEGTGIGTDGTDIYIASKFTQTVNVYPRATVSGDQAPSRTISLPGQPTALTVSGTEIYVGIGNKILVYKTTDSGAATPQRTLTLPANVGTVTGISGIQVFSGSTGGGTVTVNQTFVLADNKILVYNNGDSGATAPQNTITPAGASLGTPLAGPAYDNTDDAIFIGWYDGAALTGKVASFSRTSTAATTSPVRAPITSGTFNPYFDQGHPGGIVLDGSALWVVIGSSQSGLLRYARTDTGGGAQPSAGFTGTLTRIYKPGAMVLDASGELWFVNGKNGAEAYSRTAASGNHSPAHALTGDATGLYDPVDIAADRANGELVVMNQSPWNPDPASWGTGHAINAYPLGLAAPAPPTRTIVGSNANLDRAWFQPNLAVDEQGGEYWVTWVDLSGFLAFEAFARAPGGNVGNLRSIGGATSTFGLNFTASFYDPKGASIAGIFTDPATNGSVVRSWPRTANGDATPAASATFASFLSTPAVDMVHDLLFVTDGSGPIDSFPRTFPSGTLTPVATFDHSAVGGTLSVADPEGNELYFYLGDRILAATASAGALTLNRTISGSATKLYNPVRLAICN